MDWLKKLLEGIGITGDNVQKVIEGVEEHYKGWVPKHRFDEVNEAKKKAEEALRERDKQLADLKKSVGDNEELKKQIETLQAENKAAKEKYEAELKELRLTTAIKLALAGQVHDTDIVAGLLDKSKIEIDDAGNIKSGLEEQINSLRESKAFLFVQKEPEPQPKFKGVSPTDGRESSPGTIKNPWSKEHFNLTEQARILRENPELAKQLKSIAGG